jgi:hypothetical protein
MRRLTAEQVEREIAALDDLDLKALQQRWRELYKVKPPYKIRSCFLRRAIAYRLQEIVYGGLKPRTRKELARIATDLCAKRAGASKAAIESADTSYRTPSRALLLSPGTRLLREWNGTMQAVEVVDEGFVWHHKTYRTLSAVAVAITGTKWSGPKFFGLHGRSPSAAQARTAPPGPLSEGAP